MRPLAIIGGYFVAVILIGALLTPWLYWGGHALASRGVLAFLAETDFQKFFNRAVLVAAVGLLWPTVRILRSTTTETTNAAIPSPSLWRHPLGLRDGVAGFLIAGLLVAAMAGCYVAADIYHWKSKLPWGALGRVAISAWCVAIIEEFLFRGALLGLFLRTLSRGWAVAALTGLFAVVHFLNPGDAPDPAHVDWLTGFTCIPRVFHQFFDPGLLMAEFCTYVALGLVLAHARLRSGALWLPIGIHAGVVFTKMGFAKFTKRDLSYMPWIGPELQIGLVPVFVLLLVGALIWAYLRFIPRPDEPLHAPKAAPTPEPGT